MTGQRATVDNDASDIFASLPEPESLGETTCLHIFGLASDKITGRARSEPQASIVSAPGPTDADSSKPTGSSPYHLSFFANETLFITVIRCHASHIFIANVDCTIGVYDIETGQTQKILRGHASGVHSLEVVRQTLVSGSSDHTIRVWDLKTLTLRHILRGHEATVRLLGIVDPGLDPATGRMEPECSVIVTGSSDSTVRTWRLPEEQTETAQPDSTYLMQTFTGHTGPITAMAIHTRICVSGSDDCTVRLWDMARGQCTGVFRRHTDRITSLAYDHDRQLVLSGSTGLDGNIRVWDARDGSMLAILVDHGDHICDLRFAGDLFFSAAAGTVKVWSATDLTIIRSISCPPYIKSFAVEKGRVMTAGYREVRLWDLESEAIIWQNDIGQDIGQVRWQDGRMVVVSTAQGPKSQAPRVDVFDFREGRLGL